MRNHGTVLALTIALASLASQDASAQSTDAPTVAVMDFNGLMLGESANSLAIGKAVSAMLVTEFAGRDGLKVVERQRMEDLLQEQRLALSGRVDESSAVEVGKFLRRQFQRLPFQACLA